MAVKASDCAFAQILHSGLHAGPSWSMHNWLILYRFSRNLTAVTLAGLFLAQVKGGGGEGLTHTNTHRHTHTHMSKLIHSNDREACQVKRHQPLFLCMEIYFNRNLDTPHSGGQKAGELFKAYKL